MNDIIDHKITIIHHHLARIREVFHLAKNRLDTDLTSQDSIIFNLQRACQASVDIANHFNKTFFSKFSKDYRDSFEALHKSGLISAQLALSLQELIGFSCLAVQEHQAFNLHIVKHLVEHHLGNIEEFIHTIKGLEN